MSASNSTLPNPIVYLNYLPPSVASGYEVSQAIYVATLGAMIWDILSTIPQDWKLLRTIKLITPPYVAYHVSRWFSLTYIILMVLSCMGTTLHCQAAETAMTACIFLATTSSDFLFLTRARAIYYSNKYIRLAFLFLWIADVGVMSLTLRGTVVVNIANTAYCIHDVGDRFLAATILAPLLFDTIVYVSISVKLISMRSPTEKFNYRTFLSGKMLPRLARAVFLGGQQYYLIKICFCIPAAAIWLARSMPGVLQPLLVVPAIGVTSSMACRVYRNLRLQSFDIDCPKATAPLRTDVVLSTWIPGPMTETIISKDENLVFSRKPQPIDQSHE